MRRQPWWGAYLTLFFCSTVAFMAADRAFSQEPVGVVTALQGTAQLTRPTESTAVTLRFKDGLFIRDVVDTRENSRLRILFGGKSTVTVRELSRLEVREEALPTGGTLSIHELSSGAILVNVARQLLRPGDEVQIRTPNAVAAVRGTSIAAQCARGQPLCSFTILSGSAQLSPLGQTAYTLTSNTRLTVTGTPSTGIQVSPVQTITPAQASQTVQQYEVRPAVQEPANQQQTGRAQLQTAAQLANTVVGPMTPEAAPASNVTPTTVATPASAVSAPVVPDVSEAVTDIAPSSPSPPPPSPPIPPAPPGLSPGSPPEPPPGPPPEGLSKIILEGINTSPEPFLRLTGTFLLPAPDSLFAVPVSASIASSLLDASTATMVLDGHALLVQGALTSRADNLFFITEASTVTLGGNLVRVQAGGILNTTGSLLEMSGSSLTVAGGPLVRVEAGGSLDVAMPDTRPLLSLQSSVVMTAGSLLDLHNSRLTLAGPLATLSRQSTLTNAAGSAVRMNDGSLAADTLVRTDGTGNQLILTGSLIDLANATVTLRQPLDIPAGSADTVTHVLAAGEPLIRLADSALTLTGSGAALIRFGADNGVPKTRTGVGMIASDSVVTTNGPILALDGVTLSDTQPQLQLSNTTVTHTGTAGLIEVKGNPVNVNGALLSAGDSSLSTAASLLRVQGTALTQGGQSMPTPVEGSLPLLQFDRSTLRVADFFAELSGQVALTASLLRSTSSVLTAGSDGILLGPGSTLTNTSPQPLIHLIDTSLSAFALLFNEGGTVNVAGGSILDAVNSTLSFDFAAVQSEFGGQVLSTSSAPLIALNGGTLTSRGHLFMLSGDDPSAGLGRVPVGASQIGGALLEATNGAAIDITSNALRLDTALLEATAPVIRLIGSSTTATSLTTGGSTMDLFRSSVTSTGPVVALDKGVINVHSGPLINLADGSSLIVTGDLLSLLNGSKINVFNGPLVQVTGAGSLLNVGGALVFFGGSGGNQIIVNNSIPPTALPGGMPVSATTGGSITIGPNPVTNPGLGSFAVSPGGSVLQATNGGTVNVGAP
jgi:FecR protein